jgi:hypothetical protein
MPVRPCALKRDIATMKAHALPILCLAAALLGGCKTSAMKGTPFFTGEYTTRVGAAEDRINLWPLLYYRDPALSVLWPIGEYSDEHLAIRPLLSMHRKAPDKPYTEYNVLWPLIQFDTDRGDHRMFPFFWGEGYCVGFPLYWHYGPFTSSYGTDALFPLWIYDRHASGHSLDILWPIFHRAEDRDESSLRILPLWSSQESHDGGEFHKHVLLGLAGWEAEAHNDYRAHWFLPFYATGRDKTSSGFFSLPWCDFENTDRRLRVVPPLLSWRNDAADGARTDTYLLGLGRDARRADGVRSGHFIPFYAYGENYFLSLLYAHVGSETREHDVLPPLLSWRSRDAATGRTDTFALAGLLHRRRGVEGGDRDWLLPLYLRDEANGLFMTPLWAHQRDDAGATLWRAVPPLLSWRSRDPATGASSVYALAGLYHRRRGVEGGDRDWLLPFYYRDEAEDLAISPLFFSAKTDAGTTRGIPPLLTWWQENRDGSRSTDILFRLARFTRSANGETRGHVFPLFAYGPGSFLSLLYADTLVANGDRVQAIPPLLSWQRVDPATGQGARTILAGLVGHSIGMPEGHGRGHVFPLFAYDRDDDTFLTPLFGHWKEGGTRHRYGFTPLVASWSGHESGWWVLPLASQSKTAWGRFTRVLLLGSHERAKDDSMRAMGFFPLFSWRREGNLATALKLLDSETINPAFSESLHRRVGWRSNWLLWLGDASHQVETFDRRPDISIKAPLLSAPSDGPNAVRLLETERDGLFPIWSTERRRSVVFSEGRKAEDATFEESNLLFLLYDYRRERNSAQKHDYVRRRVLWRLWHYERLNGDVSVDLFPAITWDRREDGSRKTSFLWRLFRYERDPEGGKKLDILFIPIVR